MIPNLTWEMHEVSPMIFRRFSPWTEFPRPSYMVRYQGATTMCLIIMDIPCAGVYPTIFGRLYGNSSQKTGYKSEKRTRDGFGQFEKLFHAQIAPPANIVNWWNVLQNVTI